MAKLKIHTDSGLTILCISTVRAYQFATSDQDKELESDLEPTEVFRYRSVHQQETCIGNCTNNDNHAYYINVTLRMSGMNNDEMPAVSYTFMFHGLRRPI